MTAAGKDKGTFKISEPNKALQQTAAAILASRRFSALSAAAAATGSVVMTPDFHADEKWAELRHLPLSLGFVGAWSMPIKTPEGTVLGMFGTYFRERRSPTPEEQRGVELLAAAAALALAGPRTMNCDQTAT